MIEIKPEAQDARGELCTKKKVRWTGNCSCIPSISYLHVGHALIAYPNYWQCLLIYGFAERLSRNSITLCNPVAWM